MSELSNNNLNSKEMNTAKVKFIVISLIGVLMFFTPLTIGEFEGVGISILSDFTKSLVKQWKVEITLAIIAISLVVTLIAKIFKPGLIVNNPDIAKTFDVKPIEAINRFVAFVIAAMVMFQVGPEIIWGGSTGAEMIGLVFTVIILFLFSSFLLVTLLDFGLMDFIGVLCTKVMRKVFTLPGFAALDTLASWVGSGSIGVVITSEMYEKGRYTRREAAIIMTMFSVTSISYAVFMANYVGLADKFLQYYLTSLLCGVICAIVIPRTPPLSRFEDTYYGGKKTGYEEYPPEDTSMLKWAYTKGVERAAGTEDFSYYFKKGVYGLIGYWFNLMPTVLTVGTIGLIVVNYTPIFDVIGYPFRLILELFRIPEAQAAAPAMVTGFIDFFIPLPIANQISSLMTRFVILCMSFIQLIYLTQVGTLIIRSKVGVSLLQLFIIFLQRTIVSLPIVCLVAHIIF